MYSVNGYRRYSRDVDNAFNIIPSGRISMKGVDFPVIGVDEFGIIQFMQPEKEYQFPGNTVFEVPIMQRGGWLPSRDKVKATLNPKNWGVPDYSDKGDFNTAFAAARKAGEKEFMWNNKRFNTKSDLSEEKQMKAYGITDNQRHVKKFLIDDTGLRKNLSTLNTSKGYDTPLDVVIDVMLGNPIRDQYFKLYNNLELNEVEKKEQDALRLYLGLPQQYDTFKPSKYKKGSFELNNYLQKFPEEMPSDDLINFAGRPLTARELHDEIKNENLSTEDRLKKLDLRNKLYQIKPYYDMILGRHTVRKGKDENGEYVEYIDNWDLDTYYYTISKKQLPFGIETPEIKIPIGRIADKLNKPFNIYGRQYYKDYGDGIKRKQYFSDKELLELDINKKNFDTLALQRELRNRGYKLPKSTKKDGSLDGVWGDETKNALLDWQKKNKIK